MVFQVQQSFQIKDCPTFRLPLMSDEKCLLSLPRLVRALIKAPELCVCMSASERFGREGRAGLLPKVIPGFQRPERFLMELNPWSLDGSRSGG